MSNEASLLCCLHLPLWVTNSKTMGHCLTSIWPLFILLKYEEVRAKFYCHYRENNRHLYRHHRCRITLVDDCCDAQKQDTSQEEQLAFAVAVTCRYWSLLRLCAGRDVLQALHKQHSKDGYYKYLQFVAEIDTAPMLLACPLPVRLCHSTLYPYACDWLRSSARTVSAFAVTVTGQTLSEFPYSYPLWPTTWYVTIMSLSPIAYAMVKAIGAYSAVDDRILVCADWVVNY